MRTVVNIKALKCTSCKSCDSYISCDTTSAGHLHHLHHWQLYQLLQLHNCDSVTVSQTVTAASMNCVSCTNFDSCINELWQRPQALDLDEGVDSCRHYCCQSMICGHWGFPLIHWCNVGNIIHVQFMNITLLLTCIKWFADIFARI